MSLFDAVKSITPPHPLDIDGDDDAERAARYEVAVRRWRWKMFYGIVGAWALIVSTVSASFGVFPAVYEGFAKAADQRATQSNVNAILVGQIEAQIFNLRRDHCAALKEGRPGVGYWERLQPLLRQYETLTGKAFILPACNEL